MSRNKSHLFELELPEGGYNRGVAYDDQPRNTTVDCKNARPWDPRTGRKRASQRASLTKYLDDQMSDNPVRDIIQLTESTGGSLAVGSMTNRTQTALAVCNGVVYTFTSSAFTSLGTHLSLLAPTVFSAQLNSNIYYADGLSEKYFDGSAMQTWTEDTTNGSMPANGSNKPRLIETWGGRVVCSGIIGDRHNYFASKQLDAHDFDYNPKPSLETQAFAGNNSDAGKIGDIINGMIPFNDDLLLYLCDHSIWQLSGNPMLGGRVDRISDVVGGAFGRAWCKTDTGIVYFFGSRGGVYRMTPGSIPERITRDRVDEQMATVNLDTHIVRLGWNDRAQGLQVVISPLTEGAATHWYWDLRTDSWWQDVFADTNHNPVTLFLFDGDDPDDRVLMLGGMDGRIRYFDLNGKTDDDTPVDSYIYYGPIQYTQKQRIRLDEIRCRIAEGSDDVKFTYYRGDDAEEAFNNTIFRTHELPAGKHVKTDRMSGNALFIKVGNDHDDQTWSMESLHAITSSFTGAYARFRG